MKQKPYLGKGSGRKVYRLGSSGKVVKFVYNKLQLWKKRGLMQNEREVFLSSDPECSIAFPKLYSFAEDYSWIVVEEVVPFNDVFYYHKKTEQMIYDGPKAEKEKERFRKLVGADFWFLYRCLDGQEKDWPEQHERFISAIRNAKRKYNFAISCVDLEEMKHWGLARDGRLVILDYGY